MCLQKESPNSEFDVSWKFWYIWEFNCTRSMNLEINQQLCRFHATTTTMNSKCGLNHSKHEQHAAIRKDSHESRITNLKSFDELISSDNNKLKSCFNRTIICPAANVKTCWMTWCFKSQYLKKVNEWQYSLWIYDVCKTNELPQQIQLTLFTPVFKSNSENSPNCYFTVKLNME